MKRPCRNIGIIAIGLGITLIMAMILPADFWLFAIGTLLICVGISCCRR